MSAPKEGLQQMCQKSLLLALSLDHAMCGVPCRAMLKMDFAELEHSEETLETWLQMVKGYVAGQSPAPISDKCPGFQLCSPLEDP